MMLSKKSKPSQTRRAEVVFGANGQFSPVKIVGL